MGFCFHFSQTLCKKNMGDNLTDIMVAVIISLKYSKSLQYPLERGPPTGKKSRTIILINWILAEFASSFGLTRFTLIQRSPRVSGIYDNGYVDACKTSDPELFSILTDHGQYLETVKRTLVEHSLFGTYLLSWDVHDNFTIEPPILTDDIVQTITRMPIRNVLGVVRLFSFLEETYGRSHKKQQLNV